MDIVLAVFCICLMGWMPILALGIGISMIISALKKDSIITNERNNDTKTHSKEA